MADHRLHLFDEEVKERPFGPLAETGSEAPMTIIDVSFGDARERLSGIRAFIEHLDESIPDLQIRAQQALNELAGQEGWEYPQYAGEKQILDANVHYLTRYTTFSAVFLLWSFIETQLVGCAVTLARKKNPSSSVQDLKTLWNAVSFLETATALRIQYDPDWKCLNDMRALRNIIVHRDGRRGDRGEGREEYERLLDKYKPDLSEHSAGWEPELHVSIRLCRKFLERSEQFVKRLFVASGSQDSRLRK